MSQAAYAFTAKPRPVHAPRTGSSTLVTATGRSLYRESNPTEAAPANIMFDPRVVRGVTKGRPVQVIAKVQVPDPATIKSAALDRAAHRRHLVQTGQIRPQLKSTSEIHDSITVPKLRTPIDLQQYLVERTKPIVVATQETQTDPMKPRPPSPPYLRRKTGVDAAVQSPFNFPQQFDVLVRPLISMLLDATLDQALVEVREDETMKNIAASKAALEKKHEAREAKMAARLEAEHDLMYRKERALMDAQATMAKEAAVQAMLASHAVAKAFTARLKDDTYDALDEAKYLHDPVVDAVNHGFLPWLQNKVAAHLVRARTGHMLIDEMLGDGIDRYSSEALATLNAKEMAEREAEQIAREQQIAEAEAARKKKRFKLVIHTDLSSQPFGPIILPGTSIVSDVEAELVGLIAHRLGQAATPQRHRLSFKWRDTPIEKTMFLYKMDLETYPDIRMDIAPLTEEEEKAAAEVQGEGEAEGEDGLGGEEGHDQEEEGMRESGGEYIDEN